MIATTTDCQKLQDWRTKRPYCNFRLSVVAAIAQCQFLRAGRENNGFCRWNFILSVIVPDIYVFPVLLVTLPFPVVGRRCNRPRSVSLRWAWSKTPGLPSTLQWYLSFCRRYKYFRFRWPRCYFRLSVNVAFTFGHFLWVWRGRKICLPR